MCQPQLKQEKPAWTGLLRLVPKGAPMKGDPKPPAKPVQPAKEQTSVVETKHP
jgi:hypothetical protein